MSSVRRAPPGAAKGMSRATSASPASMPRKRSNRTTGADLMRAKRSGGAPRRTSSPRAIRMVLLNRRTTNGSSTSGTDASIVETMAMTAVARASGPRPAAARVRTAATRLPTTSHAESSGALTPRVSSVRLGAGSTIQDVRNNRTRTAAKRSGDATGGLDLGCRKLARVYPRSIDGTIARRIMPRSSARLRSPVRRVPVPLISSAAG